MRVGNTKSRAAWSSPEKKGKQLEEVAGDDLSWNRNSATSQSSNLLIKSVPRISTYKTTLVSTRPLLMNSVVLFLLLSSLASALNPAEIKGYKWFDSVTGDEIVVRGIDYYPRPNKGDLNHNSLDLFTNTHRHIWERDIPYLRELGVNAVRLYAVDPKEEHDAFMCALDAAGIYVIVSLAHACATCAITSDPSPACYPQELKTQGQQVINAFARYPNVLGFSVGNEVNHFAPPNQPEWNAPCQKKFIRDMREYVANCPMLRNVPIGLISADDSREVLAAYYNCGHDEYENAEWYGLNSYVFCDGQAETYAEAPGLKLLELSFQRLNYSIPVLLTEFGCLSESFPTIDGYPGQRNFYQGHWMLTEPTLREQFAGGFAFEYSIEMENAKTPYPFKVFGQQNYGIGYLGPEDCDDLDIPCTYHPLPSFEQLKRAYDVGINLIATTKDNFTIPSFREARNVCPEQFPALKSFTWVADLTPNSQCPPDGDQSMFVCPIHYEDLFNKLPVQQLSVQTSPLLLATAAGVTVALVVLVGVFLIARTRSDDVPKVLTIIPTMSCSSDEASDNKTDESASLLSMKIYQKGDGSYDYQATESDSSSEDLNKLGRV